MRNYNALFIVPLLLLAGCTLSAPEATATPASTRTPIPSATATIEPTATLTPTISPTPDYRVTNPENQHQYLVANFAASWHKANEYCSSLGGHLVTIQTEEENQFVSHLAPDMWLGATDEIKEGDWVWVTGEPWSYTNWYPSEPTNCCPQQFCGPQECTPESYLTVDNTGQWNDTPDGEMFFVCEWDLSP